MWDWYDLIIFNSVYRPHFHFLKNKDQRRTIFYILDLIRTFAQNKDQCVNTAKGSASTLL